jgi:NAD(P)-dependent dehydrogenase (short-subunit alcohol dehydrogenase family)
MDRFVQNAAQITKKVGIFMGKLDGKVTLITGGTTGIGFAAAKRFRAEGARVFVTGSNPATLARAREELRDVAEVIPSEAADPAAVQRLFADIVERAGGLDALFLNAGIIRVAPLSEMPEELFDDVMRVNVKGVFLALKAAAPLLRNGGSIVINGSISARLGMAGAAAYSASKGAVRSLASVAAIELASRGIRVNVLSPGPTDSGILTKLLGPEGAAATSAALRERVPLKRVARTEEIAAAALFLLSDDSSFMTGEDMVVDGGMTRA